jgi:hypothetical protein
VGGADEVEDHRDAALGLFFLDGDRSASGHARMHAAAIAHAPGAETPEGGKTETVDTCSSRAPWSALSSYAARVTIRYDCEGLSRGSWCLRSPFSPTTSSRRSRSARS